MKNLWLNVFGFWFCILEFKKKLTVVPNMLGSVAGAGIGRGAGTPGGRDTLWGTGGAWCFTDKRCWGSIKVFEQTDTVLSRYNLMIDLAIWNLCIILIYHPILPNGVE